MVLATDKAKMEVTEKYEYVNLVMFLWIFYGANSSSAYPALFTVNGLFKYKCLVSNDHYISQYF